MTASEQVDAEWLAQRLTATSSKDLGHGLSRLIDGGELPPARTCPPSVTSPGRPGSVPAP